MKIWKLKNINETSINWKSEILDRKINYVLVRAENEENARKLATDKLTKATAIKPGQGSAGSPYCIMKKDTSCTPFESEEYSPAGKEEILKIQTT